MNNRPGFAGSSTSSRQLPPEDLQCIYEMYLIYMQLHTADKAQNSNDSVKAD